MYNKDGHTDRRKEKQTETEMRTKKNGGKSVFAALGNITITAQIYLRPIH
jgi:hypothetical protein